jgi:hypothetical protein
MLLILLLLGGALYSLRLVLDGLNDGFSKQVTANGALINKINAVQAALPKKAPPSDQKVKTKSTTKRPQLGVPDATPN